MPQPGVEASQLAKHLLDALFTAESHRTPIPAGRHQPLKRIPAEHEIRMEINFRINESKIVVADLRGCVNCRGSKTLLGSLTAPRNRWYATLFQLPIIAGLLTVWQTIVAIWIQVSIDGIH
jgi:hypothetical protein